MKALEPPGDALPEWEVLHELVHNVTGLDGFKSIEGLFNQMAGEVKDVPRALEVDVVCEDKERRGREVAGDLCKQLQAVVSLWNMGRVVAPFHPAAKRPQRQTQQ